MDLSPQVVREALAQGEGKEIEFKQGLPRPEKTARTLCAFANTRGGMLFIGVDDDGRVLGAPKPRRVMADLREIAEEYVHPPLPLQVGLLRLPEGTVVCCSVPYSKDRPHGARQTDGTSEIVVRVGASNRVARGATLRALRAPRAKGGLSSLEKTVLAWLARPSGNSPHGKMVGGKTVGAFASSHNVGMQRARRAFVKLERDGYLVAHGQGARREFHLA